ncbi:hypothetical protein [Muriicola sp. Z0-33]|uniref:hypothetical protein n=1 Tax=Muriicola sp. Z0-33 TaxID=2816957 RepID=UPI00223783FD|nr:hypothetical protein [Muriicola sp. Z0-33]MCW5517438.1 hypothetical protein [Muriicola sp. Z0-33]
MEKVTPRRAFLGKALMATAGIASISSTTTLRALTTNESPYKGYNPFAVEKNDLRTFPSYPFGEHIEVRGKIFNEAGAATLDNCLLEVWHLSPNSTKYRHRGKLRTNEAGEYKFITDFPNREMGKNYKIYFKVTKGDNAYFTELSFNNTQAFISGKHWEKNNQLGEALLFPNKKTFANKTSMEFNIALNTK